MEKTKRTFIVEIKYPECDDENWSGKGYELKTIEDVDNAYTNYIRRKFEEFKELFG